MGKSLLNDRSATRQLQAARAVELDSWRVRPARTANRPCMHAATLRIDGECAAEKGSQAIVHLRPAFGLSGPGDRIGSREFSRLGLARWHTKTARSLAYVLAVVVDGDCWTATPGQEKISGGRSGSGDKCVAAMARGFNFCRLWLGWARAGGRQGIVDSPSPRPEKLTCRGDWGVVPRTCGPVGRCGVAATCRRPARPGSRAAHGVAARASFGYRVSRSADRARDLLVVNLVVSMGAGVFKTRKTCRFAAIFFFTTVPKHVGFAVIRLEKLRYSVVLSSKHSLKKQQCSVLRRVYMAVALTFHLVESINKAMSSLFWRNLSISEVGYK